MTIDTPTEASNADVRAALVAMPCPECGGQGLIEGFCDCTGEHESHLVTCEVCRRTGLRFPGLSRECPLVYADASPESIPWHESQAPIGMKPRDGIWPHPKFCECTDGRVEAFSLFALLDALRGMEHNVTIYSHGRVLTPTQLSSRPWETEQELTDALVRTLAAAVAAKAAI